MRQVVRDCELVLADATAGKAVDVLKGEVVVVELLDADDTAGLEEEDLVRIEVQSPTVRAAGQRIAKAIAY